MAAPATKRRKTDHVSSDEEDDAASFASFADDSSDAEPNDGQNGTDEDVELDAEEDEEEGLSDSEEDENVSEDGQVQTATTSPKVNITPRDNRRKSDSRAELGASAYASGTFKSNVFKLQVDELLAQLRPRHRQRETDAEAALHKIKNIIEHIPDKAPYLVQDAERDLIKEKVAIPFSEPRPPKDAKYKFAYAKPANVNVVGSFALKSSLRSHDVLEVDMVVVMPGFIFEEKDYLNYRYFHKRAYYLASIAVGLKSSLNGECDLQFKLAHNDLLKPILVVSPIAPSGVDQALGPQWRIKIVPCVGQVQFPPSKITPDKNCVREQSAATPDYNSSLRSDMLMMEYLKLLHGASKRCGAFKDACLLGNVWLRQRGFSSALNTGGFGNFEWNAMMAICLQGGSPNGNPLLSDGYSSYQLFKATLQLLAMKDFVKHTLVIGRAENSFKIEGAPLVWDAERSHNLLYKVSLSAYRQLRYEARSSLAALGDQLHDGFDATFILRISEPLHRYDYVLQIPEQPLLFSAPSLDHEHQHVAKKLYNVLKQGLGDRVDQISVTMPELKAWDLGSSRSRLASKSKVTVGLMVNQDNVRRTIDHGPSAEQKYEVDAFRDFWGEKAELRRFKNGSILESLVWETAEIGVSVLEQIVRYLLARHLGAITTDDFTLISSDFPKLVRGGSDIKPFEPLIARYKKFESDIRGLYDLPLSIRQIMPANPQLCYSSARVPTNGKGRPVPADVTIQFEGSGRWPDDLVAIQRTKIAFLLKINDMLSEAVESITTRIGLENEGQNVLNQGFLDVTYDMDSTFRLRIYHDREQTLLERQLKDNTTDPKTREMAAMGLAKYKRDYIKTPAQTQAITRLCTRFSALSGSIRLMKKWFASHLLANHISDQVIELLVIRTFTNPAPWQTPSSIQTAFLRTLSWLSKWDWRSEPLIVDLSASGDLKQSDMQTITTNFTAWRKLDPAMNRVALFTASNLDPEGTTWTDGSPSKLVAARMSALAKAACAEVTENGLHLEPATLFSSPLSDFDFVIHLSPDFTHGGKTKQKSAFKNLTLESTTSLDLIGFDPINDYLSDLQTMYGEAVLFFHGGDERNVIAGLWRAGKRAWKVNLAYNTLPVLVGGGEGGEEDDLQAEMNKDAVLAEIARVGGDIVTKVEVVAK